MALDGPQISIRRTTSNANDNAYPRYTADGDGTADIISKPFSPTYRRPSPASTPRASGPFIFHTDASKASESSALVQLLITVMGASGIVGYPFCFRNCGLGLATLLIVITVLAAEFSMQLLLVAGFITGKRSYGDLASHTFGTVGRGLVQTCTSIMNFGCLVAYLNLVTDMLSSASGSIIPPALEPSRPAILAAITLCGALPLTLFVRSPPVLSVVSQVSAAFLLIFAGVLIFSAFGTSSVALHTLSWWRWRGALVSFPVIAYGFTAHQVLFQMYTSLRSPSVSKGQRIVTRAMVTAATVYCCVGMAGFKAFGQRTDGDVLRNLGGGSNGILAALHRLVKLGYGMSLIVTIPTLALPLREAIEPTCRLVSLALFSNSKGDGIKQQNSKVFGGAEKREAFETAAVLTAAGVVAVMLPNVEYVFGLAGSTAAIVISFILPAAIFLQASGHQRGSHGHSIDMARGSAQWVIRRRAAAALLLFGFISGVACTSAMLGSIQEGNAVVQLVNQLVQQENKVVDVVAAQEQAASIAQAEGTLSEVQKELNATQAGLEEAAAAADAVRVMIESLEGKYAQQTGDAKLTTSEEALKPGIQAVEATVAALEKAASSLDALIAITRKKENMEVGSGTQGKASNTMGASEKATGVKLAAFHTEALESVQAAQESRQALINAFHLLTELGESSARDDLKNVESSLRTVITTARTAAEKVNATMVALHDLQFQQQADVLAQSVADVTEGIAATAREAAEVAIGNAKKVEMAVRAIEIAKEITSGAQSHQQTNEEPMDKQLDAAREEGVLQGDVDTVNNAGEDGTGTAPSEPRTQVRDHVVGDLKGTFDGGKLEKKGQADAQVREDAGHDGAASKVKSSGKSSRKQLDPADGGVSKTSLRTEDSARRRTSHV